MGFSPQVLDVFNLNEFETSLFLNKHECKHFQLARNDMVSGPMPWYAFLSSTYKLQRIIEVN